MCAFSSPPRSEMLPEGSGGAAPASPPATTPGGVTRPVHAWGRRLFPRGGGWLRRAAGAGPRVPASTPPLGVARSRRMRQGARAVLLWALAVYAAAQPAVRCFMDAQPPPPWVQTWHEKWEQLGQLVAREPDRPLLVMLGSSRTDRALQAGRLNGLPGPDGKPYLAYNLGLPGAGPLRVGLTLREMLDAGIRPRLLLVEFLPAFLNEPHRVVSSEEGWPMGPWLSLRELFRLYPYYARPGRIVGDWIEVRLATAYGYRSEIQRLLCRLCNGETPPVVPSHDPWGYEIPEPLTDAVRAREVATTLRMYFRGLPHFRLGRGPSRAMRDLMQLCRRENIPVVLVLTPESTAFHKWYAPEGLAAALGLLEELRQTYGADVIDATNWVADMDFIDGHHVLPRGATIFTTRLHEELGRILARAGEARGPGSGQGAGIGP